MRADGEPVLGLERHPGPHHAGALDEQLRRRVARGPRSRESLRGGVQGADQQLDLVGDGERFPARRQDRELRAAAEQVVDQAGHGVHHVLAVVDQEQQRAGARGNAISRSRTSRSAAAPSSGTPSASATATGTCSGVVDRRQPDPEGPVAEGRLRLHGGGQRERWSCRHPRARPARAVVRRARSSTELGVSCSSRPMSGRTTVGSVPIASRVSSWRRRRGPGRPIGGATEESLGPPRDASWRSTRSCRDRSDTDGSRPSSSSSTVAGAGVHVEGVGLAAAAVQRDHQQPGQGLQGRVLGDDRLQVADDLDVPAERQGDLGALGQGGEPQLVEPGRFRDRPLLGGEVDERVTAPQGQRVVVGLQVVVRVLAGGCVGARAGARARARRSRPRRRRTGSTLSAVADSLAGDEVATPMALRARRSLETRICRAFIGSTGSDDSDHSRSTSMVAGMVRPGESSSRTSRARSAAPGSGTGATVDADLHRPEQPEAHGRSRALCFLAQSSPHRPANGCRRATTFA